MSATSLPRLAVTAGDPAGIGPEILAAALADGRLAALGRIAVFAHAELFDDACRSAGLSPLPRGAAEADAPWPRLVPVESPSVPPGLRWAPGAFSGGRGGVVWRGRPRGAPRAAPRRW
jgi:4-hydroxythreonine-4-phosphate dehydrogenase